MKKIGKIALAFVLSLGIMAGCGTTNGNSKTQITLWASGSENVKKVFEKLTDSFNASDSSGNYEVKLEFILSGTGAQGLKDRVAAATKAGSTSDGFDMIELGTDEFTAYQQSAGADVFETIDTSKIPNYKNIQTTLSTGKDYLVPYRGTTVVLAYNAEKVKNVPQTATELYQWIKDNPGRFAYNTPSSGGAGASFVATSVYNQLPAEALTSSDTQWQSQWDAGFDLMKDLHPYMYQSGGKTVYPNKNQGTLDLLANGEVDMIPAWADMAISQISQGQLPSSTKISQISPSFTGGTSSIAIPKLSDASKRDGIYAFMNYVLSTEAQQILLDDMAAIPLIDTKGLQSKNAALLSELDVKTFRVISIGTLGKELYKRWDEEIAVL